VLAAELARTYGILVIERLDLSIVARIPGPSSEHKSHPKARAQRFAVAPSELRTAVVSAFRKRGGRVVSVRPAGGAQQLLAAFREGSGVEAMSGDARQSKFGRLRQKAVRAAPPSRIPRGPLET
jgi:hypothetical protein